MTNKKSIEFWRRWNSIVTIKELLKWNETSLKFLVYSLCSACTGDSMYPLHFSSSKNLHCSFIQPVSDESKGSMRQASWVQGTTGVLTIYMENPEIPVKIKW